VEMTLITKPTRQCHLRKGSTERNQAFRLFESEVQLVAMRRQADFCSKGAKESVLGQSTLPGDQI
jgi:hypothetical protein